MFSFSIVVFFYLVTTGWIFDISLFCENSIKQSKPLKNSPSATHPQQVAPVRLQGQEVRNSIIQKTQCVMKGGAFTEGVRTSKTVFGGFGQMSPEAQ